MILSHRDSEEKPANWTIKDRQREREEELKGGGAVLERMSFWRGILVFHYSLAHIVRVFVLQTQNYGNAKRGLAQKQLERESKWCKTATVRWYILAFIIISKWSLLATTAALPQRFASKCKQTQWQCLKRPLTSDLSPLITVCGGVTSLQFNIMNQTLKIALFTYNCHLLQLPPDADVLAKVNSSECTKSVFMTALMNQVTEESGPVINIWSRVRMWKADTIPNMWLSVHD